MYKLVIGVFLLGLVSAEYQTYEQDYAIAAYRVAASAYPTYSANSNDGNAINACLGKAFPGYAWTQQTTTTVDCGLKESSNNKCQMFSAVSTTNKTILLSFRGTIGLEQFFDELKNGYNPQDMIKVSWDPTFRLNKYFYNAMTQLWGTVKPIVTNQIYTDYTIVITGHSLGGALSALTAYQITAATTISGNNIHLITFGEPRVGNSFFAAGLRKKINWIWRVVHGEDPIPHLPFCDSFIGSANCGNKSTNSYYQHPQEIWYDSSGVSSRAMGANWTSCDLNNGEDPKCSDSLSDICFIFSGGAWHVNYFGHDIGTYANQSCPDISTSFYQTQHWRTKRSSCPGNGGIGFTTAGTNTGLILAFVGFTFSVLRFFN